MVFGGNTAGWHTKQKYKTQTESVHNEILSVLCMRVLCNPHRVCWCWWREGSAQRCGLAPWLQSSRSYSASETHNRQHAIHKHTGSGWWLSILSARVGINVAASPLCLSNSSLQSACRLVSPMEGCPATDCKWICPGHLQPRAPPSLVPSGFHLSSRWSI